MRNEEEMYKLILDIAKNDKDILAVYMNGSRTNKNVPRDIFQDYDIVYVVKETNRYIMDKKWIEKFGEILFMQYPDENPDYLNDKENFYGWLMQFKDGNRLDLHVESVEHAKKYISCDKLCKVLLDKDKVLPEVVPATDEDYWIKKPNEIQFLCTCNEFWWCLDNVAKGLWREEITYVQDMVNFHVRKQLEKLLSWKVGILTEFSVCAGKSAKYLNKYLQKEEWTRYLNTYFNCDINSAWNAVMDMCDLFEETAIYVGCELNYKYNHEEADNCRAYLEHCRKLPKDAKEIY